MDKIKHSFYLQNGNKFLTKEKINRNNYWRNVQMN